MALSIFKSKQEEPWDRFHQRMGRALESASGGFRRQRGRYLYLGSPVKLGTAEGDIIRAPIEVRGGTDEYAIAYVHARAAELGKADARRMETIAREAAQAAEPHLEQRPEKPGEVVFSYP